MTLTGRRGAVAVSGEEQEVDVPDMTSGADMIDEELSRAILAYDQKGESSYPRADRAAVRREFGARADDLLTRVQELTDEINAVPVDWRVDSQDDAIARVRRLLLRTHPELSNEAIEALVWDYSFGIK